MIDETVKTNSKGKANLDLDLEKGKYDVNVTCGGNENYACHNTKQKLTITEWAIEQPVIKQPTQSSCLSNEIHYDEEINVYYDNVEKLLTLMENIHKMLK